MVHPGRAILNRDPMIDGLPLPNRSHPSRAAGSFFVKSFGRREAYESPRGTNPRAPVCGLWGFRFWVGLEADSTGVEARRGWRGQAVMGPDRAAPSP